MERIPVQFKGCDDYYNENVGYPISRINLEHYLTEVGVLYFVVYLKDDSPTVTYASLTPKVIKNVLLASDKKKKTKLKHTKISSEEISDGRECSLLFLCIKVEVAC